MDSCCLLFTVIIVSVAFISGIESTSFIVQNECPYTIWPASSGTPSLSTTGFALAAGSSSAIDAPSKWVGRFWARTFCGTNSSGSFACATGDCGTGTVSCDGNSGAPPYSLAEFSIDATNNFDYYDISLVDGFNVPLTITPKNSGCKDAGCPKDINSVCPWPMAIKDSSNASSVIACKSACLAFNTDAYCCRGNFASPENCSRSDYAAVFRSQCPHTYTYSYDDQAGTFSCTTGGDYFITFCPSATSAQPRYLGMICVA